MAKTTQAKSELPAGSGSTSEQPLAEQVQPSPLAATPASESKPLWRVEVPNMPVREVEADDEAGAWEAFRKLFNVTATRHRVTATRLS